jgi:dUTPase
MVELTHDDSKMPKRNVALPQSVDLYMPFDESLHPGERSSLNLEVAFSFPPGVCGLVTLKNSAAAKQLVRMNPILVGKLKQVQDC